MNLLYLTFGTQTAVHLQAAFSIYSFLAEGHAVDSVNIITDNAGFYKHLAPRVNIMPVTGDELNDWKGKHQFFWRIKIKAIEKMCQLYPNKAIVYLDSDTFLYADITNIKNKLNAGVALMHENEGALSGKKSKTEKKMWQQIANKNFGNLLMQPTDCMWNAGVVATPNTTNGKDCALALEICDAMCEAGVTRRLVEQYAISLALQKTYTIAEAKTEIAHYWAAKEIWQSRINDFFIASYFGEWGYEKIIDQIKLLDKTGIPVYQKVKSTNLRLKNVVDKLFPTHSFGYLLKK